MSKSIQELLKEYDEQIDSGKNSESGKAYDDGCCCCDAAGVSIDDQRECCQLAGCLACVSI